MSNRRSRFLTAVVALLLPLAVHAAEEGASESPSVFCLDVTTDDSQTGQITLTVSPMEGGTYLLNGMSPRPFVPAIPQAVAASPADDGALANEDDSIPSATGLDPASTQPIVDHAAFLNRVVVNPSRIGVGAIIGSAASVGSNFHLTLHQSHADENGVTTSTWHVELGDETLEGKFHIISQDWSGYVAPERFEPLRHTSGTAKLVFCN